MENHQVYLLLGSNIQNRSEYLGKAKKLLCEQCGRVVDKSAIYLSKAWGTADQMDFLNQVLVLSTDLEPLVLMSMILDIEAEIGRVRSQKWSARTIDIDILFYDLEVFESPTLTIPHPRIEERNFTLVPLMQIAPQIKHPKLGLTIEELYLQVADPLDVIMIED